MLPPKSHLGLPLLLVSAIVIYLTVSYVFQPHQLFRNSSNMADSDSSVVESLAVSIRQTQKSPPTLAIKVTNKGPKPVTILRWDSPLDPLVLQLGHLSITPSGDKKPLDIPTIKVSRKFPPDEASLVSIEPGASKENEVELKKMIVPPEKLQGGKTAVKCQGEWRSVWATARADLSKEAIENDEGAASGPFESDGVEIEV